MLKITGWQNVNELKFGGFQREFLRNCLVYWAQIETEIVMLFQYSEILFY